MTNQQGAPEALRHADGLESFARMLPAYGFDPQPLKDAAATVRSLHAIALELADQLSGKNERLAALVEAQQPATHVQNPAEIAHVAGDVSKNGAESNMAQRPAPSAAAALPEGWVPLVITHEGQYPEEVAYGPQILMDRLGKWLRKYFDHVVASKAQPTPTPQADSQPAYQWDTGYPPLPRPDLYDGAAGTVGWSESAMQGFVDADRAARAPADSVLEDAARYRWLRHGDNDEKVLCRGPVAKDYWYLLRNEKLDAAIDAARKQGGA